MVVNKGRVLVTKRGKAIVEIDNKKVTVNIRPDIKVKAGDIVVVAFNTIIDKVS